MQIQFILETNCEKDKEIFLEMSEILKREKCRDHTLNKVINPHHVPYQPNQWVNKGGVSEYGNRNGIKFPNEYEKNEVIIKKLQEENNRLKRDIQEINNKKDTEIGELKASKEELLKRNKELEAQFEKERKGLLEEIWKFNPHYGNNDSHKYYENKNGRLHHTNKNSALYMARIISNMNEVEFFINDRNAQYRAACQNKIDDLLPFCEILEEAENANNIITERRGKAKLLNDGSLEVTDKAQIKLIKQ